MGAELLHHELTTGSVVLPCWCGSLTQRSRFTGARFALMLCPGCGTYRISPPPVADDEQAGRFYSDYYAVEHADGADPRRFWKVVERTPSLNEVGESVADIGCGEGTLCSQLHSKGWKSVIGLDLSRTRIERATSRHSGIAFHAATISNSSIPPASLDLAIMDNVIEHLLEPLQALADLRERIRPGGRVVLITPNMESGHFRLLGMRWTPELAPHAHVFLFTHAALSRLVERSGFDLEACGSFHLPICSLRVLAGRFVSGDVKGAIWRSMQEAGGIYGHLVGAGPMLYAVGRRSG